jgi:hypothetical protein
MVAGIGKYLSVYFISMLKFIGGPTLGIAIGLSVVETVATTVMGMMTTVVIISFFGPGLRRWTNKTFRKDQKVFSPRNRKFVTFWNKYGLFGISFLTPVVFSPILGTLLVNAFGASKSKILGYMLFSAIFWSLALSNAIHLIPMLIK